MENGSRMLADFANTPSDSKASPANRQQLESMRQQLDSMYAPIAPALEAVDRLLRQELQSQYECLQPLMRHGTQLGGKRLRPALLLLAARGCGCAIDEATQQRLIAVATSLELIHTATLVHDDVLDNADRRRHLPTINAQWGEHASILLGDYLFALAYRLAASAGSAEVCVLIGEAARRVCEGELRQVLLRNAFDLDEATYLDLIRGKTAELCAVACRLGAMISGGSPANVQASAAFGDALGIAFQIADDYLDLWGDEANVGKTLGTDLMQGKWTLPIIRLRSLANDTDRHHIDELLSAEPSVRLKQLMPLIERSDARQYTRQLALAYRDQAKQAIEVLPSLSIKQSLQTLADFSVCRTF